MRTRFIATVAGCMLLSASATGAFAGRPFTTEDAGLAGLRNFQLELSWDYLRWGPDESDNVLMVVPIYGITRNVEVSLEIPYLFYDSPTVATTSGVGDVNVVTKVSIFKQTKGRPAFALKGLLKTKTGKTDEGLGSGDVDYGLFAVFTKRFDNLLLHSNLGFMIVGNHSHQLTSDFFLYGLAARYRLSQLFDLVTEISGERHPDRQSGVNPAAVLVGSTYQVSRGVNLDAAVSLGLSDAVPDWNLTLGSSISF